MASPERRPLQEALVDSRRMISGENDLMNNIATCSNAYDRCGESYSVKTGKMDGPTKLPLHLVRTQ